MVKYNEKRTYWNWKKSKKAFFSQPNSKKNKVLKDYCDLIKKKKKIIIQQNKRYSKCKKERLKTNFINRLILDEKKNFKYYLFN